MASVRLVALPSEPINKMIAAPGGEVRCPRCRNRQDPSSTFTRRPAQYGCFSNFSRHPVLVGDKRWPTSEHYFQAQKFRGTAHEEAVRLCKTPARAAALGRARTLPLRPDWESVKDQVMLEVVRAKFAQHEDLRAILLGTGTAPPGGAHGQRFVLGRRRRRQRLQQAGPRPHAGARGIARQGAKQVSTDGSKHGTPRSCPSSIIAAANPTSFRRARKKRRQSRCSDRRNSIHRARMRRQF